MLGQVGHTQASEWDAMLDGSEALPAELVRAPIAFGPPEEAFPSCTGCLAVRTVSELCSAHHCSNTNFVRIAAL